MSKIEIHCWAKNKRTAKIKAKRLAARYSCWVTAAHPVGVADWYGVVEVVREPYRRVGKKFENPIHRSKLVDVSEAFMQEKEARRERVECELAERRALYVGYAKDELAVALEALRAAEEQRNESAIHHAQWVVMRKQERLDSLMAV